MELVESGKRVTIERQRVKKGTYDKLLDQFIQSGLHDMRVQRGKDDPKVNSMQSAFLSGN